MITIIDAGALQGYSSMDHLIDEVPLLDLIGRQFRSVGEAMKALDKKCFISASNGLRRHPYTWAKLRHATGETITKNSV